MANMIEVSQVVAMLGSAYPNFAASKETVKVYYELLKDLPVDLLKVAALQCCAEAGRKFAPSVGELRGAAAGITHKAKGIPSALEAWNEVCKAPKAGGTREITGETDEHHNIIIVWHPHNWSNPVVERVAQLLGWPRFPDPDNESIDRAHFLKQYEQEVERATSAAVELPEVTRYIETQRAAMLESGKEIKRLTEGMEK
jgi:hypothetical protein